MDLKTSDLDLQGLTETENSLRDLLRKFLNRIQFFTSNLNCVLIILDYFKKMVTLTFKVNFVMKVRNYCLYYTL